MGFHYAHGTGLRWVDWHPLARAWRQMRPVAGSVGSLCGCCWPAVWHQHAFDGRHAPAGERCGIRPAGAIVREAKGGKDRMVMLLCPRVCVAAATAKSILDSLMAALHGAPCCWVASSGWALGQGLSTAQSSKTTPRALNFFAYASLRLSALAAVSAAA